MEKRRRRNGLTQLHTHVSQLKTTSRVNCEDPGPGGTALQ